MSTVTGCDFSDNDELKRARLCVVISTSAERNYWEKVEGSSSFKPGL